MFFSPLPLLKQSLRVSGDGVVKSASAKLEQNTLILRDIPKSTPSGDILRIFSSAVTKEGVPCPLALSVRSDMNDTWYVGIPWCFLLYRKCTLSDAVLDAKGTYFGVLVLFKFLQNLIRLASTTCQYISCYLFFLIVSFRFSFLFALGRFVTFASEVDAKAALSAIKGEKFEGQPIHARLKTESALKSFYR